MTTAVIAEFAIVIILLGWSAFFSSAETALFSLSPMQIHRIRRHHPRKARQIEQLLAAPAELLSTLLIGNTLVNVIAADLGYVIASQFTERYAEAVAIPVMTLALILFGEVTPKRLAVRRPDFLAVRYVSTLNGVIRLFSPARRLLNWITGAFEEHFQPHRTALTEKELLTAVDVGHEEGILSKEERMMVDGIIRLETLHARDVMTPRVDVIGIDLNGDSSAYPDICRKVRFKYLPAYRGDMDHVEGFLDTAKFLLSPSRDIKHSLYPHFYVPDTAPLDGLLNTFQQQQRRVAIVIDEYGGTAGLITLGDIMDEIAEFVGSLPGEKRLDIAPGGPNRWTVNGATSIEEVNYELHLNLQSQGADRIAGWVTAHAERIPKTGDMIEADGCRVTVLQMRKHRVTLVQIEQVAMPGPQPEEGLS